MSPLHRLPPLYHRRREPIGTLDEPAGKRHVLLGVIDVVDADACHRECESEHRSEIWTKKDCGASRGALRSLLWSYTAVALRADPEPYQYGTRY